MISKGCADNTQDAVTSTLSFSLYSSVENRPYVRKVAGSIPRVMTGHD